MTTGKKIRVTILLLILCLVTLDAWLTRVRTTDWDSPLRLTLYPIAADSSETTKNYVGSLQREQFTELETFLAREARRYGVKAVEPLRVRLGPVLTQRPPVPPVDRSLLGTVWWSLKLRWWSRRMASSNNMVIVHELLHTLAATDKYQPDTGLPRFPEGYAEPERQPRFPQDRAELMGGRIPLAADRAEIPVSLNDVVVGPVTAHEIGWVGR